MRLKLHGAKWKGSPSRQSMVFPHFSSIFKAFEKIQDGESWSCEGVMVGPAFENAVGDISASLCVVGSGYAAAVLSCVPNRQGLQEKSVTN